MPKPIHAVRRMTPPTLRVLNWGWGQDSTTLALMAHHGEIPPFDVIISAELRRNAMTDRPAWLWAQQLTRLRRTPTLWSILEAARVPDAVCPQTFGPWEITRVDVTTPDDHLAVGWSTQTRLHYQTWKTRTLGMRYGEIVMEDSWRELSRHLPIWRTARGRILVTGLGLGCVVRGLITKPDVEHIDVIEIDSAICAVVGAEFLTDPRVTIRHANALTVDVPARVTWDYAWHDLYTEEGCGVPGLQVLHAELLLRYRKACRQQGAWAFPRMYKRVWPGGLLGGSSWYARRRKEDCHA